MENYDSIFAPKKQDNAKSYAPFDKEAWVQRKQAEFANYRRRTEGSSEERKQNADYYFHCICH